jgi:hypothetical protein
MTLATTAPRGQLSPTAGPYDFDRDNTWHRKSHEYGEDQEQHEPKWHDCQVDARQKAIQHVESGDEAEEHGQPEVA